MLRSRPLLIAAIIFGGIGMLLIMIAVYIFMSGDTAITGWLNSLLRSGSDKISSSTFSQIGIVFELSSLMISLRAFDDV